MAIVELSLVFRPQQPKKLTHFMLMTYILVAFSFIGFVSGRPLSLSHEMSGFASPEAVNEITDDQGVSFLPLLFRDLRNDGILKMGGKSLIVASKHEKAAIYTMMKGQREADGMMLVSTSDIYTNSLSDNTFDLVLVNGGSYAGLFDRSIRSGGVVAMRVTDKSANSFQKPDGYKIVYLRKFSPSSVIIAMKKKQDESLLKVNKSPVQTHFSEEARRAALKKLEDVLLEPPRASSGKSRSYHKRTKYLPNLLGDTLESYPRRVFIEVGSPEKEEGSVSSWFDINYPTRNLKFEKYKIETVPEGKGVVQTGMSEWLIRNVNEEEYVVMKAEAEAVEEMVKSKAIKLIDELFMECRVRGLSNSNQNRRAYWECLALYGKLRDEGVAVHQWWG